MIHPKSLAFWTLIDPNLTHLVRQHLPTATGTSRLEIALHGRDVLNLRLIKFHVEKITDQLV